MQLAKFRLSSVSEGLGVIRGDGLAPLSAPGAPRVTLSEILEDKDPERLVAGLLQTNARPIPLADVVLLPPIDRQEVWAAGVTYKRSKTARMEESESAATLYDRVYEAARP